MSSTSTERNAQCAPSELEASQDQVFEDAKAKGVDPKLVEQAKASYQKAQALYDLDLHVKNSVSGMRPDVGNAAQAAKNPETVDPKKLFNLVNSLYDSGRLQEALGEQGADDLLEHMNDDLIEHKKILRNQAIAKTAAKYAGYGVAGGWREGRFAFDSVSGQRCLCQVPGRSIFKSYLHGVFFGRMRIQRD